MPFWKKLLVVLPVLIILHLTSTAAASLLDSFRVLWGPAGAPLYLLAGFPAGYAMGVPVGLTAPPGTSRAVLVLSLLLSIAGLYWCAALADGYAAGAASLAVCGFAAGLALPVVAKALGLVNNIIAGGVMALLVAGAWWLSIPFVALFRMGLPFGALPEWAVPFYVQGFLAVLWLPLAMLSNQSRGGRRLRRGS